MVAHDDVTEQLPSATDDRVLQAVRQSSPVGVVPDDLLAGIAPRHHMVDGTLEFDTKSSWHDDSVPCGGVNCRGGNQKPGLTPRSPPRSRRGMMTAYPAVESTVEGETRNQA